ncbi:MAG: isoprenylcysteine carboxylmethyltransferase family protein [Proteobacteria bacterium]|nr:isoprenylcysteine carboxylmethyltransferase family protein [Pseudomonadota bacterium]
MFVFRTIIWGMVFMVLSLFVGPWLATRFDASFPMLDIGMFRYAGVALIAVGAPLTLYCGAVLLLPGASRPAPYDAGGVFTVAGPYRYVRNPFMLGVLLTMWGEALIMSRIAMLAYALIITWAIHFWVLFYEEPALKDGLGHEYERYRKAVPRWFPQFKRYKG